MARPRKTPVAEPVLELLALARADSLSQLAKWGGWPVGTVSNWDKRKSVPGEHLSKARRLAEERNGTVVQPNAAERLAVHEERELSVDNGPGPAIAFTGPGGTAQYVVIPRYSVLVSAGRGRGEPHEDQSGEFAFEISWMRRHLGRAGRGFCSVQVRGDSMEPTLLNGDEIIIDRQVVRVDVSAIYVIALRGDLLVKRVQRMLDGSLVVRSDNSAYPPETLSVERAEDFRVVGRMVWPRVR